MADLSEMFAEQKSNVVRWGDTFVYGIFELPDPSSEMRLTFVCSKGTPAQGVHLRLQGGVLRVDDKESRDVLLWAESAPSTVQVLIQSDASGSCAFKLWNVWRGALGVTQSWLGNAALRVVENQHERSFRILCSDGEGEPTFDDLVIDLDFSENR